MMIDTGVALSERPSWWGRFCTALSPFWENLNTPEERELYQHLLEAAMLTVPGVKAGAIVLVRAGEYDCVAAAGYDSGKLGEMFGALEQGTDPVRVLNNLLVASVVHQEVRAYLLLEGANMAAALDPVEAFRHPLGMLLDRLHLREQLSRQFLRDPLTGLLNRQSFLEALKRLSSGYRVVLLNLMKFRSFNERYGHSGGDALLRRVGQVLQTHLPPEGLLCRWGGDEFLLAIPEHLLEGYLDCLSRDMPVAYYIGTASIGPTWEEALIHVDFALCQAKITHTVQHFDTIRPLFYKQRHVLQQLEALLQDYNCTPGNFSLEFQPIVSLTNPDDLLFKEALLRFKDSSPREVLQIAERNNMLPQLTELICKTALEYAIHANVRVSINLSPAQLARPGLTRLLAKVLTEKGFSWSMLAIEVTECAFEGSSVVNTLQGLRQLGAQIWLDDFGSGYSNLDRLAYLPIDGLKLSHEFVQQFEHPYVQRIARGIVEISRDLNLRLVAEGIERLEQMELLQKLGFQWGQGFLFRKEGVGGV